MDLIKTESRESEGVGKRRRRRGAKGREDAKKREREEEQKVQVLVPEMKSKKRKKKAVAPKPGDEGYKTPTQLRNARKRRAKQRKKNGNSGSTSGNRKEGFQQRNSLSSAKREESNKEDPSTKYLSDPLACPLVEKAKQYFLDHEVEFEIYLGKLEGWRTVSKLPVRSAPDEDEKKCIIGLFKPNSHDVVSVPNCTAHHPSINSTVESLQLLCNNLSVKPFDEKDGTGYLRYVCMNVDRNSKHVQLTLVWNSDPYSEDDESQGKQQLHELTQELLSKKDALKIHSVYYHFNAASKHADNVFDFGTPTTCQKLWKHIYGPRHIIEILEIPDLQKEIRLFFPPNVFRQANLDAFTKIVATIRNYIIQYNRSRPKQQGPLPSCLELYGGVGTIGLHLHDLTSNLLSSDENPFNIDCFMSSVKLLGKKAQGRIKYLSKDATSVVKDESSFPQANEVEVLIVDPPRKGLNDFVLQSLIFENESRMFHKTKVLIYVSCGFEAFQRDCDALLKSKKWVLDQVEGHILFPGSNAIETLAFFKSK
mmetsp:Transcript_700/g.1095  ORF Transcript_700/g.1095 Transcript_700/m.1095 type:complete len:536 (+) Transcript_700:86-1693(+)|eukprot:CAMPEP_0203686178 /NCGR_PEP_ID=MMETSP0090-20130426/48928_1 /ASSEMBLY_ACC=CAM_ASM_001088 /TAXON_ID=426623 /ORGANISM="Chaetoceros affinis, Strain CCMP159" /LENGTH=535 /DNA_ID=CAMNT_0050555399 /DNA_START=61 /DNA_END=1668 /DNA_ORIENTATION=+